MNRSKWIKENYVFLLECLFIFVFAFFVILSPDSEQISYSSASFTDFSDGWLDASGQPVKLENFYSMIKAGKGSEGIVTLHHRMPEIRSHEGLALNFMSCSCSLDLILNGSLIYHYKPGTSRFHSETGGLRMHSIPLDENYSNQEIYLRIKSVYQDNSAVIAYPSICTFSVFVQNYLFWNAPFFAMSLFSVFFSSFFLIYSLLLRIDNPERSEQIILAVLSILLGIDSFLSGGFMPLLLKNPGICVSLSILIFYISEPLLLRFCCMAGNCQNSIWQFLEDSASFLFLLIVLLFQLGGFADFHETFGATIASLAVTIILSTAALTSEGQLENRNLSHSTVLIYTAFFLLGITYLSTTISYLSGGRRIIVPVRIFTIGQFMFSLIMLLVYLNAVQKHNSEADLAKSLAHVAYADAMTGLDNLAAYLLKKKELSDQLKDPGSAIKDVIYWSLDLNFLKKVNDTYGHAAGNIYIIDAARVLQRVFGVEGTVYRTGGDEFAVLTAFREQPDLQAEYHRLSVQLESAEHEIFQNFRRQASLSPTLPSIQLSISYGCASFLESGESFDGMEHAADKRMYQKKLELKGMRTD